MAPKSGFEMCFAIGPIGAGGKTRLESSTKKKEGLIPILFMLVFQVKSTPDTSILVAEVRF